MSMKPFFILVLVAASFYAKAQHTGPSVDTVLKGATIEVEQSYKPQVKQAPKPIWTPQLPPADTTHPIFSYDVPQQTLYYTYTSQPLRPLALGKDTARQPFANYIAAGGGNLSTLYLDAGIGSIKGTNYETDIHIHDISQKGNIEYQQSSLSGLEAEGTLHEELSDWHAAIDVERNQYYYYGYDHHQYDYTSDEVRQTYTTIRACVDTKNTDSTDKIKYHPAVIASLYDARFNTSETNIGVNAPFAYDFDNMLQAMVAVNADIAHLATSTISANNGIAELLPGLNMHTEVFDGHALLGLAVGMGGSGYILPDVGILLAIPNTRFRVSAGYQSTLRQNTYEQLSTENPYLSNVYAAMQTKRDELYAGLQGSTGNHLSYSGRISWWQFAGLPTFLNDTGDHKQFYVVYDNVKAASVQLGARYTLADKWSAGITGDFYHFYNGNQPYVWQEPNTKIKGDFTVMLLSKLTITAYLAFMDGIYAKDGSGSITKLKAIADLGGKAEYQIIPRLSAFVQLDNILNDQYQRWLHYQAYGINVYGGLRLKF